MAVKKIPCGGFYYDDSSIEFIDGVIQAKKWIGTLSEDDTIIIKNSEALIKGIDAGVVSPSQVILPLDGGMLGSPLYLCKNGSRYDMIIFFEQEYMFISYLGSDRWGELS